MYTPSSRNDNTSTNILDGSTFVLSNSTTTTSITHDNNTTLHGTHVERNLKRNNGQVGAQYSRSNNVSVGGQGLGQGPEGGGGGGGEEPRRRKLPLISTRVKMRENLFPAADGPCAYFAERRVKLYHSLGDAPSRLFIHTLPRTLSLTLTHTL